MKHVAIDLGGRESQVCIRTADGVIVEENRVPTKKLVSMMSSWESSRVILETSSEAFKLADAALEAKHQVRVVPATLVRSLNVGGRNIKTDRRDARALSEASCRIDLPSVHIPSSLSRELKSICGTREGLVEARTKLINNVRGWLRTQLWRIRTGATMTFHTRLRAHAVELASALPEHIERSLQVIELLTAQIKDADAQLRRLAKADSVCIALMTVPGVGPTTAIRFKAALDEVGRFSSAHGVQSYLGLTPGERSSSDRQHRTGITKAGTSDVRRLLVQSSWSAIRTAAGDPMVGWALKIAQRRGKFVAVVALARKLAGILFAIWRDGTTYQAKRGAATA